MGKQNWMSPEQYAYGRDGAMTEFDGEKADVFSCGMLLFHLWFKGPSLNRRGDQRGGIDGRYSHRMHRLMHVLGFPVFDHRTDATVDRVGPRRGRGAYNAFDANGETRALYVCLYLSYVVLCSCEG